MARPSWPCSWLNRHQFSRSRRWTRIRWLMPVLSGPGVEQTTSSNRRNWFWHVVSDLRSRSRWFSTILHYLFKIKHTTNLGNRQKVSGQCIYVLSKRYGKTFLWRHRIYSHLMKVRHVGILSPLQVKIYLCQYL